MTSSTLQQIRNITNLKNVVEIVLHVCWLLHAGIAQLRFVVAKDTSPVSERESSVQVALLRLSLLSHAGQTTVTKWAPIRYIIPINDAVHRPLKNVLEYPQKFHDKAVQSNTPWLNLNKINGISILQYVDKQGNPLFHFHAPGSKRRYPCTQTAAAVPKYVPVSYTHLTLPTKLSV